MTVITYRAGVLAADSGNFQGCVIQSGANKVARAPDGTLHGATGNAADASTYLAWVRSGCVGDAPAIRRTKEAESEAAFHVLRVRPNGAPELLTAYGIEIFEDVPYLAFGAASEAALGALYAGATAVQAVEAAIAHSQWAHGPVRSVRHED
jgi:hypothetical protein